MSSSHAFTLQDIAQLASRGISPEEAERQLEIMARPAAWADLVRPCTVGDGILSLDEARVDALVRLHAEQGRPSGRVSAFVPASGAATRMFKDLLAARDLPGSLPPDEMRARDDAAARALVQFVEQLPRFAFAEALAGVLADSGHSIEALRRDGPWRPLLEGFLGGPGGTATLAAAQAPKGQLYFHRDADGVRTAFEEHLHEALPLTSDAQGVRRLDVTVSPEHRAGFEQLLAQHGPRIAARAGGRFEVAFSEQHPATDTIAGDPSGGPFRDAQGRLLFRPAGHGALLRNLQESGRDLVFLKNIDNVAAARLRPETARWSAALVGLAIETSERLHTCVRSLADGSMSVAEAYAYAGDDLALAPGEGLDAAQLARVIDRPIRVCGMVRNTGEPGGGPFWVRGLRGVRRQVVESAQVDPSSPGQQAILGAATHFNPVFMVCALRNAEGRMHTLDRFVDDAAVIVTRKSHGGRDLLALERPGLWNGAMAYWHTLFVEVPLGVFNPVKTVFDLLRPEHQG